MIFARLTGGFALTGPEWIHVIPALTQLTLIRRADVENQRMPCPLGTRTYPENATVCSPDGWVLQCSNGEWINTGQRCVPHASAPVDAAPEARTLVTPTMLKKKTGSRIKEPTDTKAAKTSPKKIVKKAAKESGAASKKTGGSKATSNKKSVKRAAGGLRTKRS